MNPLLIVLTPVSNEAWILSAFLKATSTWADYIIVADQMSTDGSRNIYSQYDKVIVIDNPISDMHQARTRKLLFDYVRNIEGDKILCTLDADEFLSGDFTRRKKDQRIFGVPVNLFNFYDIDSIYRNFDPKMGRNLCNHDRNEYCGTRANSLDKISCQKNYSAI